MQIQKQKFSLCIIINKTTIGKSQQNELMKTEGNMLNSPNVII